MCPLPRKIRPTNSRREVALRVISRSSRSDAHGGEECPRCQGGGARARSGRLRQQPGALRSLGGPIALKTVMTGACSPPLPAERGVAVHGAAHAASAMPGSTEAAAAQASGAWQRSSIMLAAVGVAVGVLLALVGLAARWHGLLAAALWRDAQSPALGAAILQLCSLVVCLYGHFSPSTSAGERRKFGGLLLLVVVAGSALPSADAVSVPVSASGEDVVGDLSHWAQQSRSEPSPPSSRPALENQTFRAAGTNADELLPKGALPEAGVLRQGRASARKLLRWPPGVSTADDSPGPDPEFMHKEKRLKDMSKKMEARLERWAAKKQCIDMFVPSLQLTPKCMLALHRWSMCLRICSHACVCLLQIA